MRTTVAVPITDAAYELAEGVLWDDRAGLVRWVDIWKGRVLSGSLRDGRLADIRSVELGQTAGAVALAEDGGLLVAAARGLATISADGRCLVRPRPARRSARRAPERRVRRSAGAVRRRQHGARRRDGRRGAPPHLGGRRRRDAPIGVRPLERDRVLARRRHDLPRRHRRGHRVPALLRTRRRSTATSRGRSCSTTCRTTPTDSRSAPTAACGSRSGADRASDATRPPASSSRSSPSMRRRPRARRSSDPTSTCWPSPARRRASRAGRITPVRSSSPTSARPDSRSRAGPAARRPRTGCG